MNPGSGKRFYYFDKPQKSLTYQTEKISYKPITFLQIFKIDKHIT